MYLSPVLLVLPILRRSESRYDDDQKSHAKKEKAKWARPDSRGRPKQRFDADRHLSWGRWLHNDTIGWLEIGYDKANRLGGDVFLKRKFMARRIREQVSPNEWRTISNPDCARHNHSMPIRHEVRWVSEIQPRWANINDNQSCADAVRDIVKEARTDIRERFPKAEIWLPPFGWECINWVEAIRQIQEGAKR